METYRDAGEKTLLPVGDELAEFCVGDELIDNGLKSDQCRHLGTVGPTNSHQEGHWSEEISTEELATGRNTWSLI